MIMVIFDRFINMLIDMIIGEDDVTRNMRA